MLSSFDLNYNFDEEVHGYVLESTTLTASDQNVKLYIPTVMNGIKKGDPSISILRTLGKGVFCNAGRKPATSSPVLKEKNYLTSTINVSANINDLDSTIRSLTKNEKYVTYNIEKGSIVRSQFLNGKVSKLSFKTTKDRKTHVVIKENKKI